MDFNSKVAAVMEKREKEKASKSQKSTKFLDVRKYWDNAINKKIKSLHYSPTREIVKVIDRLKKEEADLKCIQKTEKFWEKRCKEAIKNKLNPWLSQDFIANLPYIEDDPQDLTDKNLDKILLGLEESGDTNFSKFIKNNHNRSRMTNNISKISDSQFKSLPDPIHSEYILK